MYWSERIERLLRACVRDRDALPAAQTIDVPFNTFMADDIAVVEKIYQRADMPFEDRARRELDAYLQAHPRGKEGRIVYDLEGDFGISQEALRERFQFYFERFPDAR